jgi:hypothetical protein
MDGKALESEESEALGRGLSWKDRREIRFSLDFDQSIHIKVERSQWANIFL